MTPRKPSTRQRSIAKLGRHGRRVRVFRVGDRVTVQCRVEGITKSYRGPDAEAKAMGFAQRIVAGITDQAAAPRRATVGELWDAYTKASDFRQLRPRSAALYRENWSLFTTVVPLGLAADDVTVAMIEEVRTALEETPRPPRAPTGLAVNTVRKAISVVKGVWSWGERTEFLHRNRIHAFKFKVGKDQRPVVPDEYTNEDFAKLLSALSFDKPSQRTAYTVLALVGYQGVRINAALHLRWEDVCWTTDELTMRSTFDKMGEEWVSPMRAPFRAVLARLWESVDRPKTGWVFPSRRKGAARPTYTVQSFWLALREAEERAGVTHSPGRAAHGFRRGVAGDVAENTGSALLAMEAIGDRGTAMAPRYIKRRAGRVASALRDLDTKGA